MKISVIIPLYNAEAYIEETMASVLASTHDDFEVIVVDDGSTDRSASLVERIATADSRVRLLRQENAGPSRARNRAIQEARGAYIFPLDADDLVAPTFLAEACAVLDSQPTVKLVCPTIAFMGNRQGVWRLPDFSRSLLARRNHIAACALYRRSDWEQAGGYCEEMKAREDWDFWISMLKDGGEVVRLPEVGYWYRVHAGSKRFLDRRHNAHVIAKLNERHPEFFERELGGPLRRMRSWSRLINWLTRPFRYRKAVVAKGHEQLQGFVESLPHRFEQQGVQIFKNRNAIRRIEVGGEAFVVKEFCLPLRFNRFAYRWLRGSKAARSFRNAQLFRAAGVGTPEPIGYCEVGGLFFIGKTYYVCRESTLQHDYRTLPTDPAQRDAVLRAIAATTARMHDWGWWHKDYSGGNILWDIAPDGHIAVELIDLNRMRFGDVGLSLGCANFDRLPATPEMQRVLAESYARQRGYDAAQCFQAIQTARHRKAR